jgi:hypothetical protein
MFILGTYVQTGCLATPSSTTSRPANKTALAVGGRRAVPSSSTPRTGPPRTAPCQRSARPFSTLDRIRKEALCYFCLARPGCYSRSLLASQRWGWQCRSYPAWCSYSYTRALLRRLHSHKIGATTSLALHTYCYYIYILISNLKKLKKPKKNKKKAFRDDEE